MINGIVKQTNVENMPTTDTRTGRPPDSEKVKNNQDNVVRNDDLKKDNHIDAEEAMERIVNTARFFNREIRFEVERDLDIMIVKVIDGETGELIRQIPPEELVELSKNAQNLKGLLIDKEG